jgi:hypothetical protein
VRDCEITSVYIIRRRRLLRVEELVAVWMLGYYPESSEALTVVVKEICED